MKTQNTYKKAILNRLRILKSLNRFGWLRTRDIAALVWLPTSRGDANSTPNFAMIKPTASGIRMAQRTMRDLQKLGFVLQTKAPDGAVIYALSQKGAETLKGTGIDACSGKDLLRAHSFCFYRHRCISTEIAISALLHGCKISTELELSRGGPFTNKNLGKTPDVLIRNFESWYWVEVERSRRNRPDYLRLLRWLNAIRTDAKQALAEPINPATLKVVFICRPVFAKQLISDLLSASWSAQQIESVIDFKTDLYTFEVIPIWK